MFPATFLVALMSATLSQAAPITFHMLSAANITFEQTATQNSTTSEHSLSDEEEKKGDNKRRKFLIILFICLAVLFTICIAASICDSGSGRKKQTNGQVPRKNNNVNKPAYFNSTVARFAALFPPPYSESPPTPSPVPVPPPEELPAYELDDLAGRVSHTLGTAEELGVEDGHGDEGDSKQKKGEADEEIDITDVDINEVISNGT